MTKKFLSGTCDCVVDSDVGTGNFLLVLKILHVSGHGIQSVRKA